MTPLPGYDGGMETVPKPRRRWFRFSLRTMFVVTALIAISFWWALRVENWRQARGDFISRFQTNKPADRRMDVNFAGTTLPWQLRVWSPFTRRKEWQYASWSVLRLDFGQNDPVDMISEAKSLFPEAEINVTPK